MKRIITTVIIIMAAYTVANAQLTFGIKGGVNFATISNYDNIDISQTVVDVFSVDGDNKYRTGFHAGLLANYTFANGFIGLQPEVLYSNQGTKYSGAIAGIDNTSVSATIKTDYINVPVMLQVNIIPRTLYVEAGPQVGFLVASSAEYEIAAGSLSYKDSWDVDDQLNTVDFSLGFGAGFKIPRLPLGVHARYTIGLTEVDNDASSDNSKTVNGVFMIGAFLRFGGGK